MWIVRKINNNCALARDSEGQDVVVFGKGIGFRRPPYELTDLSVIERTFYGVKGPSLVALRDIPNDVGIVEDCFGRRVDTESFSYARFVMHLRFLVGRIEGKGERSGGMAPMLDVVRDAYPESYACTQVIVDYLSREFDWTCDESETLYLLIYVQRLRSSME